MRFLPAILIALLPGVALSDPTDICADRPGQGAAPCTVPQGHWQVEVDGYDSTFGRGIDTTVVTQPTLKYGVGSRDDLEITMTPFLMQGRMSGFGDTVFGEKHELWTSPRFQAALISAVKLPTANSHLGNGRVEGSFSVPLALNLNSKWSLNSAPQVSWVVNQSGHGYHLAESGGFVVQRQFASGWTVSGDVWSVRDDDPAGPTTRYTTDYALSYIWRHQNQFDCGVNVGLNSNAPRAEFYFGYSRLF